jgi:hypothetical protein
LASQAYIVASGRKGVAVKSKSEANNNIEVLVVQQTNSFACKSYGNNSFLYNFTGTTFGILGIMHERKRTPSTSYSSSSNKRPMHYSTERSDLSFDRSQHDLEQLRFYCMDHDTEKATLRSQLDRLDRQLTYYHGLCREQEATIKDVRSQLYEAEAENVALRDERDARRSETETRDRPLDTYRETDAAKATSRKRYRAPTVEYVTDEEYAGPSKQSVAASEQQHDTTNHVLEVFLTFVWVTDSRMNERQAVYIRQQQSLRNVLGHQVFGRFLTDARAFVYKAQRIRDVGQTAAEVSTLPTHTSSGRVS